MMIEAWEGGSGGLIHHERRRRRGPTDRGRRGARCSSVRSSNRWCASATALLGDRAVAEDVVQDAFVAVGRKLATLEGSEVAYLRRAVVNGCRGSVRRGRAAKRQAVALVTDPGDVAGADVAAGRRADHARILAALDGLSGRQRQCLVLRYYAGLTDAETAHATGLHIGSVKTHIRRGLDALRPTLEDIR